MKLRILIISTVLVLSILNSCKKEEKEDDTMDSDPAVVLDCDGITYDAHISKIFNRNCGGCHVTGSQGGINFNDYAKLKNQLEVGKVLGVINHKSGFKKMPTSGIKMPQQVLDSIDCWVTNGYKEN